MPYHRVFRNHQDYPLLSNRDQAASKQQSSQFLELFTARLQLLTKSLALFHISQVQGEYKHVTKNHLIQFTLRQLLQLKKVYKYFLVQTASSREDQCSKSKCSPQQSRLDQASACLQSWLGRGREETQLFALNLPTAFTKCLTSFLSLYQYRQMACEVKVLL